MSNVNNVNNVNNSNNVNNVNNVKNVNNVNNINNMNDVKNVNNVNNCSWRDNYILRKQQQHAFHSASNFHNSEEEVKMTADMTGGDSLASQCLAFCQTLASQGMDFHFSLTINSNFSFSLATRKIKGNSAVAKKRSSPSPRGGMPEEEKPS